MPGDHALLGRRGEGAGSRRSPRGCAPGARRCSAAPSPTRWSSTCGPCFPRSSRTWRARSSTPSRATTSTRTSHPHARRAQGRRDGRARRPRQVVADPPTHGIDPDRWAEEKRRGLTIDLGYAWSTLPSGREIGFVDVPGHERFIGNMLAGVGPVRLVLFVVAADEGWKPQSEEHLQILDVLGVRGGVVALTKATWSRRALALAEDGRAGAGGGDRLRVRRSSRSPPRPGTEWRSCGRRSTDARRRRPDDARARLFVDRVFTIKGAGTVVTGTSAGCRRRRRGRALPERAAARIRSLRRTTSEQAAPSPASPRTWSAPTARSFRAGTCSANPARGVRLRLFEGELRPVRGLAHPITSRGASSSTPGAAEVDARLRLYGTADRARRRDVRSVPVSRPLALESGTGSSCGRPGDGRRSAAGWCWTSGRPRPRVPTRSARLTSRRGATREELAVLLVGERGAISRAEALSLTGSLAEGGVRMGDWLVAERVRAALEAGRRARRRSPRGASAGTGRRAACVAPSARDD